MKTNSSNNKISSANSNIKPHNSNKETSSKKTTSSRPQASVSSGSPSMITVSYTSESFVEFIYEGPVRNNARTQAEHSDANNESMNNSSQQNKRKYSATEKKTTHITQLLSLVNGGDTKVNKHNQDNAESVASFSPPDYDEEVSDTSSSKRLKK